MLDDLDRYAEGIAAIESSGNYRALGRPMHNGDRAIGRYQVMASNVPEWTQAAGLGRMTPYEFWQDQDAQDRVFRHRFGGYVSQYGNPQDAASAWFTGRPLSHGGYASDGAINGYEYVRRFNQALGQGGTYHRDRSPIDFASFGVAAGEGHGGSQPIDFASFGVAADPGTSANSALGGQAQLDQRSSEPPSGQPSKPQAPPQANYQAANEAMHLNPQEQALYQRHLKNLYGSGGIDQPDGSRSSLLQTTVGFGDKTYNLPTVYDGKQLSPDDAIARAKKEGLDTFPSYGSEEEAEKRYGQMHDYMDKDTGQYLAAKNRPGTEIDISQFGAP